MYSSSVPGKIIIAGKKQLPLILLLMRDADFVFLKKSLMGLLFMYLLYIPSAPGINSLIWQLPLRGKYQGLVAPQQLYLSKYIFVFTLIITKIACRIFSFLELMYGSN